MNKDIQKLTKYEEDIQNFYNSISDEITAGNISEERATEMFNEWYEDRIETREMYKEVDEIEE